MTCANCGNPLRGNQRRFCSRKCKEQHALKSRRVTAPLDRSGAKNPNWKGGHRHWALGRYGKDKDGLSRKTQRKLAWERDGYTCQHCGEKKQRNPDVHHKVPFRVSQSHALDNLICLCQKCHLTEEAKVQDQWGGQLVAPTLCACGQPLKLRKAGLCYTCASELIRIGDVSALQLRPEGLRTLKARLRKAGFSLPESPDKKDTPKPRKVREVPRCGRCGAPTHYALEKGCRACLLPWVLEQRKTRSLRSIAAELGVTNPTIVHWCHFSPG